MRSKLPPLAPMPIYNISRRMVAASVRIDSRHMTRIAALADQRGKSRCAVLRELIERGLNASEKTS